MFEQWVDKAEPSVRLITKQGSALPAELGPRDWMCLGPAEASAEIALAVERMGFHFFHSEDPLPDPDRLKNSNAAGA